MKKTLVKRKRFLKLFLTTRRILNIFKNVPKMSQQFEPFEPF